MLELSSDLSSALLDTMSALTLDARCLSEVRETVVRTLPSAALSDLPAIVRFILQSAYSAADASEVTSCSILHLHDCTCVLQCVIAQLATTFGSQVTADIRLNLSVDSLEADANSQNDWSLTLLSLSLALHIPFIFRRVLAARSRMSRV